jgi:hypothetical protein
MSCMASVTFTSPVQAFVRHQRCVSRVLALIDTVAYQIMGS